MSRGLYFRRFDRRDATPVWQLHEKAMRDAGTDPKDIPGTEDLRRIESVYLDSAGEFIVGILPETVEDRAEADAPPPHTFDGRVVAMGGFLPADEGYEDEREVHASDTAELHRMRVAPTHQHRGYGTRLLAELERRAMAAGFDRLLATTAARQEAAAEFYPARGYDEVGRSEHGEYELIHFEKTGLADG